MANDDKAATLIDDETANMLIECMLSMSELDHDSKSFIHYCSLKLGEKDAFSYTELKWIKECWMKIQN